METPLKMNIEDKRNQSMDLTGLTNPKVTFNYTQQSWGGDQDQRTSSFVTSPVSSPRY